MWSAFFRAHAQTRIEPKGEDLSPEPKHGHRDVRRHSHDPDEAGPPAASTYNLFDDEIGRDVLRVLVLAREVELVILRRKRQCRGWISFHSSKLSKIWSTLPS